MPKAARTTIRRRTPCVLVLAGWILSCPFIRGGQEAAPAKDAESQPKRGIGVVVLPILFYIPETKWGGGVGGLVTLRSEKTAPAARPSSVVFDLIYTQLKQFSMEILPEIYFKGENILVTGSLTWQEYPDKFWGVGPATPDDAEENYTPRSFVLKASLQKKIWPSQNLFAGIQVLFSTLKIVKTDPGRSLDRGEWPGSTGETTTGLGFILNRDTRDNIFFPMKGDYWRFGAVFNQKFLGGQYNYASFELDLRKYLTLFGRHVLALQGLVQATAGTPAFVNYPRLGGDSIMRGYYYGRYRDKWLMAAQAEYRLPLWWRLGLVAFAGLGDVAGRLSEFNSDTMKYSAGFGIRFKIVPKEGANLRLDFAWGKRSSGIYFTAREAF